MGRDGVQAAKEREGIGRVVSVGGGWGGASERENGVGGSYQERERERERERDFLVRILFDLYTYCFVCFL